MSIHISQTPPQLPADTVSLWKEAALIDADTRRVRLCTFTHLLLPLGSPEELNQASNKLTIHLHKPTHLF